MGHPLRQETREKISKAQTSTDLSEEDRTLSRVKAALSMIENGYEWNNREMFHRGLGKLVDILLPAKMDSLDYVLLANRRELFMQQIEEKRNK